MAAEVSVQVAPTREATATPDSAATAGALAATPGDSELALHAAGPVGVPRPGGAAAPHTLTARKGQHTPRIRQSAQTTPSKLTYSFKEFR